MAAITRNHFKRAAADIGAHGDNDTLPFDIDNRFVKEKQDELVDLAYALSNELAQGNAKRARNILMAEASALHYLRTLRFAQTKARAAHVRRTYSEAKSHTVRRACIDCWRQWKDRASFTRQRNQWNALAAEEQRMLWLSAGDFGDEGLKFRKQVSQSIVTGWELGIERSNKPPPAPPRGSSLFRVICRGDDRLFPGAGRYG